MLNLAKTLLSEIRENFRDEDRFGDAESSTYYELAGQEEEEKEEEEEAPRRREVGRLRRNHAIVKNHNVRRKKDDKEDAEDEESHVVFLDDEEEVEEEEEEEEEEVEGGEGQQRVGRKRRRLRRRKSEAEKEEDRKKMSFYFKILWFTIILCGIGSIVFYPMIIRHVISFHSYKPSVQYNYTEGIRNSLRFYRMQRAGAVRDLVSVVYEETPAADSQAESGSSSPPPRPNTRVVSFPTYEEAEVFLNSTFLSDDETDLREDVSIYGENVSVYVYENYDVKWRGEAAMNDMGLKGESLTGGYFDAGDHVKFGFPHAFTITTLAWGLYEFESEYKRAGMTAEVRDAIRWGTDFILKSHPEKYIFYGLVGDPDVDHDFWGRPEDMKMERPAFAVTTYHPGTELVCEAAAALSLASIVFQEQDPTYSSILRRHAIELFEFGDRYRGNYVDAIPKVKSFYNSWSGYGDELGWASFWLYKATGERKYLEYAEDNFLLFEHKWDGWAFSWDNKRIALQLLLAREVRRPYYINAFESSMNRWLPMEWKDADKTKRTEDVTYTPKGLAWRDEWGTNRYAANMAFLALVYANILDPHMMYWDYTYHTREPAAKYRHWARNQMDYLLGSSGRSYVVGMGHNPPARPHHRAASCEGLPGEPEEKVCDKSALKSPEVNPHVLYGALVGGPDKEDHYVDDRKDYQHNEVAIDYNCGFQSALAGFMNLMP
eukprot:Nk52_evm21s273 gene=Nk52_evmTU21s273